MRDGKVLCKLQSLAQAKETVLAVGEAGQGK